MLGCDGMLGEWVGMGDTHPGDKIEKLAGDNKAREEVERGAGEGERGVGVGVVRL